VAQAIESIPGTDAADAWRGSDLNIFDIPKANQIVSSHERNNQPTAVTPTSNSIILLLRAKSIDPNEIRKFRNEEIAVNKTNRRGTRKSRISDE
jgi:hypothetical protein